MRQLDLESLNIFITRTFYEFDMMLKAIIRKTKEANRNYYTSAQKNVIKTQDLEDAFIFVQN
ncbi:2240_t:CDS:2 [Ambispora leptoticha]|uniref:2240_t:CDS:1 n=1 Tax=Ambispora leptoticha TaxID=144679 RepID=A0A9N9FNI7_9GLOM|nr:2240_t:CDS:2 [Ambispora leptoticha]